MFSVLTGYLAPACPSCQAPVARRAPSLHPTSRRALCRGTCSVAAKHMLSAEKVHPIKSQGESAEGILIFLQCPHLAPIPAPKILSIFHNWDGHVDKGKGRLKSKSARVSCLDASLLSSGSKVLPVKGGSAGTVTWGPPG